MAGKIQSAERVSHQEASDNYVFQRSILAYHYAAERVSGRVLEIGTGSGYGVSVISPRTGYFLTVDKHVPGLELTTYPNVEFRRMKVPPLHGIEDDSFDFVITFQVIEHIRRDEIMIREIHRVLRPGGKLIISTPNRAMSLTRNPWHVREYLPEEFSSFLGKVFGKIEPCGVYGNGKVMEYYEKNRAGVEKIARYDLLGLRNWLPRPLLRIPYDVMNRLNRRKLLDDNTELTTGITMSDYHVAQAGPDCFDLLYTAEK